MEQQQQQQPPEEGTPISEDTSLLQKERTSQFSEDISLLICGLCLSLPRQYRHTACCDKSLCLKCSRRLISESLDEKKCLPPCPYCRKENMCAERLKCVEFAQQMVDRQKVTCRFCESQVHFGDQHMHYTKCEKCPPDKKGRCLSKLSPQKPPPAAPKSTTKRCGTRRKRTETSASVNSSRVSATAAAVGASSSDIGWDPCTRTYTGLVQAVLPILQDDERWDDAQRAYIESQLHLESSTGATRVQPPRKVRKTRSTQAEARTTESSTPTPTILETLAAPPPIRKKYLAISMDRIEEQKSNFKYQAYVPVSVHNTSFYGTSWESCQKLLDEARLDYEKTSRTLDTLEGNLPKQGANTTDAPTPINIL